MVAIKESEEINIFYLHFEMDTSIKATEPTHQALISLHLRLCGGVRGCQA